MFHGQDQNCSVSPEIIRNPAGRGQKFADAEDHRRPLRLFALHGHEAHRRPLRRFTDRLGIGRIVLLPLDEGLDVGRRDEPHVMAQLADLAAPVVRAAAGFHRNDAARHLAKERQHLIPPQLLAQHRLARLVSLVDLKHILRQVEPDSGDLRHAPLWLLADPPWHIEAIGGAVTSSGPQERQNSRTWCSASNCAAKRNDSVRRRFHQDQ